MIRTVLSSRPGRPVVRRCHMPRGLRASASHCTGSIATSGGQNCILEPSGTSIVIMIEGTVSRPQAAFSLMQCSIDPFSEHFLPDIAWTLDGKCLCALTTHGQLFIISGACIFFWCRAKCTVHFQPISLSMGIFAPSVLDSR